MNAAISRMILYLLLLSQAAFAEPPVPVIAGPTEARTGDLIYLDAGESQGVTDGHYSWLVDTDDVALPQTDGAQAEKLAEQLRELGWNATPPKAQAASATHRVMPGGKAIMLASYPGTWRVYLAVANSDGVAQKSWKVKVTSDGPEPPDDPDPPPPVDPPPPTVPVFGLTEAVKPWLGKVPSATLNRERLHLSAVYEVVGRRATAGKFATIEAAEADVKAELTTLVTQGKLTPADWRPFGENLNASVAALRAVGTIKTPKDWGYAIVEVSEGLK